VDRFTVDFRGRCSGVELALDFIVTAQA